MLLLNGSPLLQIKMPDGFQSWVETMDALFPALVLRLIRGPMWSGAAPEEIGRPMAAKCNFAAPSKRSLNKRLEKSEYSKKAVVQV